jgi:hypothetical protein
VWWLAAILSLTITLCFSQKNDCDLKRNDEGINVYVCKSRDEKFKTLRAEFVLENTSIATFEKFLLDVENYPAWQYNMVRAQRLQTISDSEMIYRSEVDAPWPVDDRELILNFKISREGSDQSTIVINHTLFDYPIQYKLVRVPFFFATYQVSVVEDISIKIIYTLKIDPGGYVPPWLVNLAMAEGPYISFKNLKARISKPDTTNN